MGRCRQALRLPSTPSARRYLHEALPGDEALSTKGVDQCAHVLLVLIGTVQGTNNDLTQHLWQEMLWRSHVSHAVHGFSQVLAAQVLRHDGLLSRGTRAQTIGHLSQTFPIRNKKVCSQSFFAAPPWQGEVSCSSSGASPGWEEGWSSGQAVEAKPKGHISNTQRQPQERHARDWARTCPRGGVWVRGGWALGGIMVGI